MSEQKKDIINWYPGHMNKSINIINNKINDVDFYIEVLDARATKFCSNNELNEIFKNKPRIRIALKDDYNDGYKMDGIIYGSIHNKTFQKKIIEEVNKSCKEKIESKKRKGYVNVQLCGMVVGLPNIGKSSIINFLLSKNQLIAQDRPGVTKKITYIKVSNNIVLFDTPGIFFKKVEDFNVGAILTLIKSVSFDVVNKYEVLEFGYNFYMNYYNNEIKNYYSFKENLSFNDFLNHICEIKKFKLKNNENDLERCFLFVFNDFSMSKICKISFDRHFF